MPPHPLTTPVTAGSRAIVPALIEIIHFHALFFFSPSHSFFRTNFKQLQRRLILQYFMITIYKDLITQGKAQKTGK